MLVPAVESGELEVGILATPLKSTLLDELILFEEPFLLAVPSKHPLANRKHISPRDIESERLLLLKDTHCLRGQVTEFCSAYNISGVRQSAAASIATLLTLVSSNAGITLIPRMATSKGSNLTGIRCIPVEPAPSRRVKIIFRKTSKIGQRLAEAIFKSVSDTSANKR